MAATAFQELLRDAPEPVDPAVVKLLQNRYGDGLVYLRGSEERALYSRAVSLGFINGDGYLTSAGRSLLTLTPRD